MTEKNENFMLRWYNEVWNNGKEDAIDNMMHPKVVAHGLGAEAIIGVDTFKDFYRAFNKAFSKIHITVDKNLVDGNFLTAICTVNAVHNATGNEIKFTGSSTAELENGVMINAWNFFDFLTLNLQTGKIKPEQLLDL